jgi:hypothetical protein
LEVTAHGPGGDSAPATTAPVTIAAKPTLPLTGPLTYAAGAAAGVLVANIGNVPAGVTPTLTPNDGRVVIAGDATNGWKAITGMTASSAGKFTLAAAATGATGASADVTVTAPAVTYPANMTAKWDAADLTLADGADVTSWTDSISGAVNNVSGSGGRPKFKAAALGGKPGVSCFNQRLSGAGSTALNNVTNSGTFSLVVIMSGIDWAGMNNVSAPFSSFTGNGNFFSVVGSNGPGFGAVDKPMFNTGSGLHVAIFETAGNTSSEQFHFFDGTAYSPGAYGAGFNNDFCIGGFSNDYSNFRGVIHKVMFYPRLLTQIEALQIQKVACDEYGQAYPWAGKSSFVASFGDSLTYGYGATNYYTSYPNVMARTLGRAAGTYTGLGFIGFGYGGLEGEAQKHIDGISAITGIPTTFAFFEWYNEAYANNNGDVHSTTVSFIQKRQSVDPTMKVVLGTSTDSNSNDIQQAKAGRATFNSYFDTAANRTALSLAGYAPLHNSTKIGVAGAAPAQGTTNTYFQSDSVHLTDAGFAELASLFGTALTSAGLA